MVRKCSHANLRSRDHVQRDFPRLAHHGPSTLWSIMVIRITWGKLRSGAWGEFERTYRDNLLTKGKRLKGLRGRWLADRVVSAG
jgi:hypothetical protein